MRFNNLTLDYTLQTPSMDSAQYTYLASILTSSMISYDPVVSLVNLIDNAYCKYIFYIKKKNFNKKILC